MMRARPQATDPTLLDLAGRQQEFLGFLARRVGPGIEPREVLQRAMLRAVEHIEQLRDRERATAWFYAILRRTVADARDAKVETIDVEVERLADAEPVLQCDCSLRELDTLPTKYADILRRLDLEGQSPAEVAGQLGISGNNVTVRLHRARQALRARLKERCGTTSVAMCQTCTC